jgi:hypothetical protein
MKTILSKEEMEKRKITNLTFNSYNCWPEFNCGRCYLIKRTEEVPLEDRYDGPGANKYEFEGYCYKFPVLHGHKCKPSPIQKLANQMCGSFILED